MELVSPICRYADIETTQEIVRKFRGAGAIANSSCGLHIHVDASPHSANSLRNITNIMASKEDLIYKAMQVEVERENRYCRKVDQRFLEELNRKKPKTLCGEGPERFPETECVVERALEFPKAEYRECRNHLSRDMPFIAENRDWMSADQNGVAHCLLVIGEGGSEGVLVNSEGSDYARYASLVPRARELVAAEQQELEYISAGLPSLRFRDLILLGLPANTYLVDDDYNAGFIPVGGLKDGNISEKAQERFTDLLDAPIKAIRPGAYGTEIVISGVPTERLSELTRLWQTTKSKPRPWGQEGNQCLCRAEMWYNIKNTIKGGGTFGTVR